MTKLTNKQKEQLDILVEECAEVQKEASKLKRFGIKDEYQSLDNFAHELGDLIGIMEWVVREFDINPELLIQYAKSKQEKMLKWTFHQKGDRND